MSIKREQRKGGTVWRVRWRDSRGRNRSRVLGRKSDAEAFEAEIVRRKRTGELAAMEGGRETLDDYVAGRLVAGTCRPPPASDSAELCLLLRPPNSGLGSAACSCARSTPKPSPKFQGEMIRLGAKAARDPQGDDPARRDPAASRGEPTAPVQPSAGGPESSRASEEPGGHARWHQSRSKQTYAGLLDDRERGDRVGARLRPAYAPESSADHAVE